LSARSEPALSLRRDGGGTFGCGLAARCGRPLFLRQRDPPAGQVGDGSRNWRFETRDGEHGKLKIRDLKMAIANPKFKIQNSKLKLQDQNWKLKIQVQDGKFQNPNSKLKIQNPR
jgi:hypothetical protein